MKNRLLIPLVCLLLVLAQVLPASASRLSGAESVLWHGGPVFLDRDAGELVSLETDAALLGGVVDLQWDGEALWARTAEAWFRVEEDGGLTRAGYQPGQDSWEDVSFGFAVAKLPDGATAVLRLSDGAELLRTEAGASVQVCRDASSGETYILSGWGDVLRADGSPAVPEGTLCELVRGCFFSYVLEGYAFGYLAPWDEEHPRAAAVRLSDGALTVFDGWWNDYVGWGMIYPDGTAVVSRPEEESRWWPSRIVRWTDGEILLDLPVPEAEIITRYAGDRGYLIRTAEGDSVFIPEGGTKQAAATPPEPALEYVRDENGRSAGIRFLNAAGEPLSDAVWSDVFPYNAHDADLLSPGAQYFNPDGGALVTAEDGKLGILGLDGTLILPAACDSITYREGQGYLVRKDGEWMIFLPDGSRRY